jgi:alkylation response protein AidB-like acyl-CoA dehydrogenase
VVNQAPAQSSETLDPETFRQEIRQWLEANCPPSLRKPATQEEQVWGGRRIDFPSEDAKLWFERCVEKGYCVPDWPVEYGGAGFTPQQTDIFKQEMARLKARAPQVNLGIWMAGPVILEFGTEEQKREHLPKIARGEIRWCQGYSEPGAGSDLAGLQCKAEDKGDYFLVNGSKIWTSYADKSDYIYCLVRTDFNAPKREGITFLLFDMASEGVSTKPIELITGEKHFCQTFFDNVKVPKNAVLGEINKGWTVAKRVLEFERNMMSDLGSTVATTLSPRSAADKYLEKNEKGELKDTVLREAIARHEVYKQAFDITQQRMIDEFSQGAGNMDIAMIFKYCGTEEEKRKYELMLKIMGERALGWMDDKHFSEEELSIPFDWMGAKTHTIAGGTTEIQLNIIAKRVLGLPGVLS